MTIIGASTQQPTGGRGGAGNIHFLPREREATGPGPKDYSDTRGRDPIPANEPHVVCDLPLLMLPPPSDVNPRYLDFLKQR
jgi:hypothetical protein